MAVSELSVVQSMSDHMFLTTCTHGSNSGIYILSDFSLPEALALSLWASVEHGSWEHGTLGNLARGSILTAALYSSTFSECVKPLVTMILSAGDSLNTL